MTKKELIEKMESCRALADEILDDVQSMEGKAAHPQMRLIANKILDVFKEKLPVIVEDINHAD